MWKLWTEAFFPLLLFSIGPWEKQFLYGHNSRCDPAVVFFLTLGSTWYWDLSNMNGAHIGRFKKMFVSLFPVGPLAECFDIEGLDPDAAFKACQQDVCAGLANGDLNNVDCMDIESFVKQCQDQGGDVKNWRNEDRCCKYNRCFPMFL